MLTQKQHDLLDYIRTRLSETGISPSFEEMKEALNLKSKSGVHRLISALEQRDIISRLPNRARALELVSDPKDCERLRYSRSIRSFTDGELLNECFRRNIVRRGV